VVQRRRVVGRLPAPGKRSTVSAQPVRCT